MASNRAAQAAFTCTECGAESVRWLGRCPECQSWGTLAERFEAKTGARVQPVKISGARAARPITQTAVDYVTHLPTGIGELDRVLGGGVVPGAAILMSGEPGVGKSTLLLELCSKVASTGARVLYLSAEESVNQVRLRAERTDALHPSLYLASETDLGAVLGQIEAIDPALVIVDSVQTVASDAVASLAGQPGQVREVASALIRTAKSRNVPVVIVGHVTKDGQVAGPRLLEHLVDVVAHVEGDRQTALRFVRTLKNRFGPTDEVGCFEMQGDGMREVPDPSGLFLSHRGSAVSGTCVTIALEGRRALPVEVQALVVATSSPNPRRVTNGVDSSRVAMLLAVLERRVGVKLAGRDVYVSTVGGVKLVEPAADLAIAAAIASAAADRPVREGAVVYGEVSLAGEVRGVTNAKSRAAEAKRMGFASIVDADAGMVDAALATAIPNDGKPGKGKGGRGAGAQRSNVGDAGGDLREDDGGGRGEGLEPGPGLDAEHRHEPGRRPDDRPHRLLRGADLGPGSAAEEERSARPGPRDAARSEPREGVRAHSPRSHPPTRP